MVTPVEQLSGVGPKTAEILQAHGLASAEAIIKAGVQGLQAVPGFGPSRAASVIAAAKAVVKSQAASSTPEKKNQTQ